MIIRQKESGFTLLELVIVLAIIGFIVGTSISAGVVQVNIAKIQGTKKNLATIRDALELYHTKNERYPCPADPSDLVTDATFGLEAINCEVACPTGLTCTGNIATGSIPFEALGISESISNDGWDSRINYTIDRWHTRVSEDQAGTIVIQDFYGNNVSASPMFSNAIYALVSHGSDGNGAWSKFGGAQASCGATSKDIENCDYGTDAIFMDSSVNDSEIAANYYDDVILWKVMDNIDKEIHNRPETYGQLFNTGGQACGVTVNKDLYCWGFNASGQVGDGTTTNAQTPTLIGVSNEWKYITGSGNRSSCGIKTDNLAYCWGRNNYNLLGTTAIAGGANSLVPIIVEGGITNWSQVNAGDKHVCGIASGRAYCWARNNYGQVGTGVAAAQFNTPQQVSGNHTDWQYIVAGTEQSCGIRGASGKGALYCWGRNNYGKTGNGTGTASFNTPQLVSGGYVDWEYIETADQATCGLRVGRLYCWGRGDRLGINTSSSTTYNTPQQVNGSYTDWTSITGGGYGFCGIRNNNRLYCWGLNHYGVLGVNNSTTSYEAIIPEIVSGGYTDWVHVSGGWHNSCGLRADGGAYCWGANDTYHLGTGSTSVKEITPIAGVSAVVFH